MSVIHTASATELNSKFNARFYFFLLLPISLSFANSDSICLSPFSNVDAAAAWNIAPKGGTIWCIYNIQGVGNYREFMSVSFPYDTLFIFMFIFYLNAAVFRIAL